MKKAILTALFVLSLPSAIAGVTISEARGETGYTAPSGLCSSGIPGRGVDRSGYAETTLPRRSVTVTEAEISFAECGADRDIYGMISPKMIAFYETYISEQPTVSGIRPARLKRMASDLNVSENKLRAAIILRDLAMRTGDNLDVKAVARYSDAEFYKAGKRYLEAYGNSIAPEKKEFLKQRFKEEVGIG